MKTLCRGLLILLLTALVAVGGQGFSWCHVAAGLSLEVGHVAVGSCGADSGCDSAEDHETEHQHSDEPCRSTCFMSEEVFANSGREIEVPSATLTGLLSFFSLFLEAKSVSAELSDPVLLGLAAEGDARGAWGSLVVPKFTGCWLI